MLTLGWLQAGILDLIFRFKIVRIGCQIFSPMLKSSQQVFEKFRNIFKLTLYMYIIQRFLLIIFTLYLYLSLDPLKYILNYVK